MTRLVMVLSVIVGAIGCVAIVIAVGATLHVDRDDKKIAQLTQDQIEGRRLALDVTCAFGSAISEAGRKQIEAAMPLPPGVEKLLVEHGFPPFAERKAQAQILADAYAQDIADRVQRQVGRAALWVVNPDGTLNCHRLRIIARAK